MFEIKSITSISSASCFSSLIYPSFISFLFSKVCVICFSTFLIQLNKMLTRLGYFKLLVNTSSGISLNLLVFRLPSFNFLAPFFWFELPLWSRFFEFRSKYFVTLHKKWSFPWRISSVSVTKSAVSCQTYNNTNLFQV